MNIVTAWAESCAGPGWSNQLVWYIWRDDVGKLHQGCLQPAEQTRDMHILFAVSREVSNHMACAVRDALAKPVTEGSGDVGREG